MTFLQAIFLSVVQGITEFLPISSKGHLNLALSLLGMSPSMAFDIFLNTATLISVIIYFRRQINYFFNNIGYIIVGTLPAVFFGFFFKTTLEIQFTNIKLLPYFFLITASCLFLSKYINKKALPLNLTKALLIGLFQATALIPGISRSGITIFAGLLTGLSPLEAFNFSFSLFIPASIGALLLDYQNILSLGALDQNYLIAFVVTTLVGIIALKFLKNSLTSNRFWYFSIYLVLLAFSTFLIYL